LTLTLSSAGRVVGVDVSAPLLEVARRRAPHLDFLEADAHHALAGVNA
jgi:ubiquinone/menaquinone biosynthesis C-methylase UbiE